MSKTDVLAVLDTAPESVLEEVYHYALFLLAKSDAPVRESVNGSRSDMVKTLRGSIKYNGNADNIRAERLGLV